MNIRFRKPKSVSRKAPSDICADKNSDRVANLCALIGAVIYTVMRAFGPVEITTDFTHDIVLARTVTLVAGALVCGTALLLMFLLRGRPSLGFWVPTILFISATAETLLVGDFHYFALMFLWNCAIAGLYRRLKPFFAYFATSAILCPIAIMIAPSTGDHDALRLGYELAMVYLANVAIAIYTRRSAIDIKEATDTADRALAVKSDFLAKMGHELRTPLNAIIGLNELIAHESASSRISSYSTGIKSASRSLLLLINDVLDVANLERDMVKITNEPYKLSDVIDELIDTSRVSLFAKDIDFVVKIKGTCPNALVGSAVRLRQVLSNLLSNAIKYTKEGFVVFELDFEMCGDGEVMLCATVTDSGIGIKEETLPYIFDEFTRDAEHENSHIEGMGLGLAIARTIARQMGGDIEAKSVYGKGSSFTATIKQEMVVASVPFARVDNAEDLHVLLWEPTKARRESLTLALDCLGVSYDVVGNYRTLPNDVLYEAMRHGEYTHFMVPIDKRKKARTIMSRLDTEVAPELILLASYGDATAENETAMYTPYYCRPIANLLNGIRCNNGAHSAPAAFSFVAPGARVLVVDDAATNRITARGILSDYEIDIDEAEDGETAIKKALDNAYDVILMDQRMPNMNGTETTKALRRKGYDQPIILLSANEVVPNDDVLEGLGLDAAMTKPVDVVKLDGLLKKYIPADKIMEHDKDGIEWPSCEGRDNSAGDKTGALNIPGIDIEAGIKNVGGKYENLEKVMELFVSETPARLAEIASAASDGDLGLYSTYVHALKSSLANIGAKRASGLAARLEAAGDSTDATYINAHTPGFLREIQNLSYEISLALKLDGTQDDGVAGAGGTAGDAGAGGGAGGTGDGGAGNANGTEGGAECKARGSASNGGAFSKTLNHLAMIDLLDILARAAKDYDRVGIKSSIRQLREMDLDDDTKTTLHYIATLMLGGDFDLIEIETLKLKDAVIPYAAQGTAADVAADTAVPTSGVSSVSGVKKTVIPGLLVS